jgi:hypothetical protein
MSSLTSANSVIMLTIDGLYNTPQQIQGYSADDIFDMSQVSNAETSMGIDGRLSAGWIPAPKVQTFTLQADSASCSFLDNWIQSEQQIREKLICNGSISLTAVGNAYTMVRGFLTSFNILPDAKKFLQPRKFVITWQDVIAQQVA